MFQRIAFLALLLQTTIASADAQDIQEFQELHTDVAIIGGGAAGTYAAVRLREDFNTSIILIEPRSHLGGSVDTYTVPETNTTLEYGVQSYLRFEEATNFFARFEIPIETSAPRRNAAINVNVETGGLLKDYIPPSSNATSEAFQRWLTIVKKYETYFEPGYWGFPFDVPSDLLTPFGVFATQNHLEAAIPRILQISGAGSGGIRDIPVFNLIRAFGSSITRDMLANDFFVPQGSNSLVYQRARDLLGADVLLSSTVRNVERTYTTARLTVDQAGKRYIINAKRILYTAPPSTSKLAPYHLDAKESAAFSTWSVDGGYVGIAKIPCIPENTSVSFLPPSVVPANQLSLRDMPYSLRLDSTGPVGLGLFRIFFGANSTLSQDELKHIVIEQVHNLQNAGTVKGDCSVDFRAISDHTRPEYGKSAEQLKNGFVKDLFALQGYKAMWYSGYIWAAPYSSAIWAFTDTVLAMLLKDLRHNPT